jgi:Flp pilus assembly protein TadG
MIKQKGQAVIEFAVILPLFVLFLFGIVYSGMLFYDYISLSNLARSAAREAAIVQTLDTQSIESYYTTKATGLLTSLYTPTPEEDATYPFKIALTPSAETDLDGNPILDAEGNQIIIYNIEVRLRMVRNTSSPLLEIFLPDEYSIVYFMRRDDQFTETTTPPEGGSG